jgi:hypothetical protein
VDALGREVMAGAWPTMRAALLAEVDLLQIHVMLKSLAALGRDKFEFVSTTTGTG